MDKEERGGIGFLGLLTILFIGLKLTGYIQWSWWWVTCPIWIIPAILVAIGGIVLVVFAIGFIFYLLALACGYKVRG
jgi:hypothetical protein